MGVDEGRIAIPKVWRSELGGLALFGGACVAAIGLSQMFPGSIIVGELFSLSLSTIVLKLPLFAILPAGIWFHLVFKLYNVRYSADARGLEAILGILSLNQRIVRVRYEDIRSIETDQTLVERFLDVGDVEVGTAATAGIELTLQGVSAPKEVQEMLQAERDKRQRLSQRNTASAVSANG